MTARSLALGTLGLLQAVLGLMVLAFQFAAVAPLVRFATDSSMGLAVNARSGWSLAQLVVIAAMLAPLAWASIGTLVGRSRAIAVLRACAAIGGACSAITVLLYAAMVAPYVADGGPALPLGPRANLEFLGAAVALALQLLILLVAHQQPPRLGNRVFERPPDGDVVTFRFPFVSLYL